jgi:hypothetical protein
VKRCSERVKSVTRVVADAVKARTGTRTGAAAIRRSIKPGGSEMTGARPPDLRQMIAFVPLEAGGEQPLVAGEN